MRKPPDTNAKYTAINIPDVEHEGFCFTDGCGRISRGLAKEVAQNIGICVTTEVSSFPSH